ncbi:MAG: HWE histidine kinase domain-containing protein, partial [Pseudomonadota bacterium]|nr:HWE histidine kinase domain-containing protein [Pseudomonadota bacterium]
ARTLSEFTDNLDGRIHSLARAHDQLTSERWVPASLRTLIECELEAYAEQSDAKMHITGPDVLITPTAYTTLALVLHELTTNSVKHGALGTDAGRVEITLSEDDSGALLIDWIERGGPAVIPPERRGFGSLIVENSIPHELKGDADISYKTSGFEGHFRIPASYLDCFVYADDAPVTPQEEPKISDAPRLTGNALIVEDSLIIAMDLSAMMEDMGFFEVKTASNVKKAMAELETGEFDFAVLDVNLGSEQSIPVAEALHKRGVPFVLTTGYGDAKDVVGGYPPCPIVHKPISEGTLVKALMDAQNRLASKDS